MLNKRFISKTSNLSQPSQPTAEQVVLLIHGDGQVGDTNYIKEYSTYNQTFTSGSLIKHSGIKPYETQDLSIDVTTANWIDMSSLSFNPRTDDWTFECWFNASSSSGTLLSSNDDKFYIMLYTSFIYVSYDYDNLTINYNIPTSQWKHFAITSTNGKATLYIDGTSIGSTTNSAASSILRTGFTIGARKAQGYAYAYTGLLSDIRLTKTVVYTSNFSVPTSRLSVLPQTLFLFNIQNNIAKNYASNSIALSASIGVPTLTFGQFDTGLYFNGSTTIRSYNQTDEFNLLDSDCTIEMFIKKTDVTDLTAFFALVPSGVYPYTIMIGTQSGFIYCWIAGSAAYNTGIPVSVLQETKHFALTNHNKNIKIYIDGTFKYEFTHQYDLNYNCFVSIGSYIGNYSYTGMMDEIRISKGKIVYTSDFEIPTVPHSNT